MALSPTNRRIALVTVGAVALFAVIYLSLGLSSERWVDEPTPKADSVSWRTSVSLAVSAVTFLAIALALGPIRVLRGGRPAVHLPWRRSFGVGGALLASAHLMVALTIHGRLLRPWHQFFSGRPSLSDPFTFLSSTRGVANWIGLGVATTLVALAILSRSSWMRRLGAIRWKAAQRAIYVVFLAVAVHAFLYWRVEERLLLQRVLVLAPIAAATALQLAARLSLATRGSEHQP